MRHSSTNRRLKLLITPSLVDHEDAVVGGVERGAQQRERRPQLGLDRLAGGDVVAGHHEGAHRRVVEEVDDRQLDRDRRAVRARAPSRPRRRSRRWRPAGRRAAVARLGSQRGAVRRRSRGRRAGCPTTRVGVAADQPDERTGRCSPRCRRRDTTIIRAAALCTSERNFASSSLATSKVRRSVRSRIDSTSAPSGGAERSADQLHQPPAPVAQQPHLDGQARRPCPARSGATGRRRRGRRGARGRGRTCPPTTRWCARRTPRRLGSPTGGAPPASTTTTGSGRRASTARRASSLSGGAGRGRARRGAARWRSRPSIGASGRST